jgi:hypothetical protein
VHINGFAIAAAAREWIALESADHWTSFAPLSWRRSVASSRSSNLLLSEPHCGR